MRSPLALTLTLALVTLLQSSARAQAAPSAASATPTLKSPVPSLYLLTLGGAFLVSSALFMTWTARSGVCPDDDQRIRKSDWITAGVGASAGVGLTIGGAIGLERSKRRARWPLSDGERVGLILFGVGTVLGMTLGARLGQAAGRGFCPS